ncbi:integrin alpha [Halorarius litoreus]|uniref:integrin alpha n=1 Tax=Halorarius litoreus TaxID=2962676 RepID=UPI0020CF1F1F|nr:integrin alpha [Halorarius litoreus]
MAPTSRSSVATVTVVVVALLTVTSSVAVAAVFADGPAPSTTAAPSVAGTQAGGTAAGDIDLDEANLTFAGDAFEGAGTALAGGVDVNGDGTNDVLVGAPTADRNGENSGVVYVFFGPFDEGQLNASDADATLVGARGDQAGYALAVGDFDDDGTGDVAVGAPLNDTAGRDAGRVYLVSGDDLDGTVSLPTAATASVLGAGRGDVAGYSLAAVGTEFDPLAEGSGAALLVGAPGNDSTAPNAGAAYLLADPLAADGDSLGDAATTTYVGAARGDVAGFAVAAAGNVSGDERPELLVGAPRNDSNGTNSGAVYVLGTDESGRVPVTSGVILEGAAPGDQAGRAVASAGDPNDDGITDVVVGAPFADRHVTDADGDVTTRSDAGAAYIVHGPLDGDRRLSAADVTLTGVGEHDRAGWAVAAAGSGDVTCDGVDDVLVGAPYNNSTGPDAGATYLVYGDGPTGERSLSTAGARFLGVNDSDRSGWAVAGANDSTGDGDEDLLVGAPRADAGGTDSGAAYLVFGKCPATPTPTPTPEPDVDPVDTRVRCSDDGATLTVRNENDDTVRVVVDGPNGYEERVTLDPDEAESFDDLDDGRYTVRTVRRDGRTTATERVRVACPTERVDADLTCRDDGGELRVHNPNDESVRVEVRGPNGYSVSVTLSPGETERVDELDDGDYTVTTRADSRGNDYRIGRQTVTVDCETPTFDRVRTELACRDDGGELRVRNANDDPVRVTLRGPDGYRESETLSPGETERFDELDDGDYVLQVFDGDRELGRERFTVDCERPQPALTELTCRDDGALLKVRNPNDDPIRVEIRGPDGFRESVTLDAGETEQFDELPNGDYVVGSFAGGEEVGRDRLTADCATPEPEPAPVRTEVTCRDDGALLKVRNTNEQPVRVEIRGPDGFSESTTIESRETLQFPDLPNGDYVVGTFDDGAEVGRERVRVDCATPEPEPEAVLTELTCRSAGALLKVRNPNQNPVRVEIRGPSDFSESVSVDPGETLQFPDLPNGEYVVGTFDGDDEVGRERLTADCEPPEPVFEQVLTELTCRSAGALLKVRNPNDDPVRVEIRGPSGFSESVSVDPGETLQFPDLPNGEYVVGTFDDSGEVGRVRLTANCEPSELDLLPVERQVRCTADGGELAVRNANDAPVRVNVTGEMVDEAFVVPPRQRRDLRDLPDGVYVVTTRTPSGAPIGAAAMFVVDCGAESAEA